MTATRLVPMASRIGMPKYSAKIGVSSTPPPMPVSEAIGTSLVAVITTSAASSSVHLQRHTTDIRLGMTLELATSLGAAVMAYLVGYFNRNFLEGLFAAFLRSEER